MKISTRILVSHLIPLLLAIIASLALEEYRPVLLVILVLSTLYLAITNYMLWKDYFSDTAEIISAYKSGEFSRRLGMRGIAELDQVSQELSALAHSLSFQLSEMTRIQRQRDAIISALSEGLIAVDSEQRILEINRAAADLLKIDFVSAKGKLVPEVLRFSDLQKVIEQVISTHENTIKELCYSDSIYNRKLYLRILGNIIHSEDNSLIGAVFIITDVTRVRQLENIRRDFVANVSHELKTPITSIKGFVETILSGAVKSELDQIRFLKIIEKHTNRLSGIIEDLLMLARLESDQITKEIPIDRKPHCLRDIFKNVVELCESRASNKNVSIKIVDPGELSALINNSLIEQALINILDNAIKYSDPGTTVTLHSSITGGDVNIHISDEGPGIPSELQDRIFERFYRIDKARSRQEGGTGLGLAIAKHIATVHHGALTVKSKVNEGSTFTISLPGNNMPEVVNA